MKKVFLLFAVVCISTGVFAQKGKVTSAMTLIEQGALDKAKEALDQAMNDPKSAEWFNTYFAKGKLYQAVFKSDNPKFKEFSKDPLGDAYTNYEKAMELDPKGGTKKRIITGMIYNNLALDLYTQGGNQFEAGNYEGALKSFETQIKITESDKYVGVTDTGMYYNAGLAAMNAGKQDVAIKYFEKCAEMKYMGVTPYFQISQSYMALGDTAKAEALLKSLPDKFPGDKNITLQLIDLYIKAGKNDEALKNLAIAKADDPDNYSLWFAEGIIYLNTEKYDEAIADLTKSIELKSDMYDSQYGLGAAYINKASDMFVKANDIMDVNKYNAAIEEAMGVFSKALPYMEKANELKPDDIFSLRGLKELYYRLKMTDKYNVVKAKLDTLEQK
ncbi:MAG TPA: tetratricopeptide repeat protein [Bacteroidales bacterium]|jgi:tetratricopeptide (TPR) repeat protein|nr:tetratricopeptide repeat protein [Bacteroidales bacterium]